MAIWIPHTPRPKILVSYLLLKLTMFEIPGGIREIGGQKSMGMGRVTPPKKLYGICNCQGLNEDGNVSRLIVTVLTRITNKEGKKQMCADASISSRLAEHMISRTHDELYRLLLPEFVSLDP